MPTVPSPATTGGPGNSPISFGWPRYSRPIRAACPACSWTTWARADPPPGRRGDGAGRSGLGGDRPGRQDGLCAPSRLPAPRATRRSGGVGDDRRRLGAGPPPGVARQRAARAVPAPGRAPPGDHPAPRTGRPELHRPLERFRLAEDEIRPLLMGTQLYGDRMLAVRELYQNALDACRHRKQRAAYGAKRELFDGPEPKPEIHFVQAYDGDRPYIECRDEGSGMSRSKLTSMFARAGRRTRRTPTTSRSDATGAGSAWSQPLQQPLRHRRVQLLHAGRRGHGPHRGDRPARQPLPFGRSAPGHGPVRVRTAPDPGDRVRPCARGTVVRLYLSSEEDEGDRPSVVKTLRRLLWVSEFEVTAEERGRDGEMIDSEVWKPGVLLALRHALGNGMERRYEPVTTAGSCRGRTTAPRRHPRGGRSQGAGLRL